MLGRSRAAVLKRSSLDADDERVLEAIERQAARMLDLKEELRRVNPKQ
jgi:hypothetical protein